MNCEDLLLKTADHIEHNPGLYRYTQGLVMANPSAQMCMLARMGHLAGAPEFTHCQEVATLVLGMWEGAFYERIEEALMWTRLTRCDPRGAAKGLRALAPRYRGIPKDVRAIFAPPFQPHYLRVVPSADLDLMRVRVVNPLAVLDR